MARVIDDDLVEPVVGVMLGATEVDDGPTEEQLAVIRALAVGYWGRTDLDVGSVTPLAPTDAAAVLPAGPVRERTRELLVLLELCRHPGSDAQVTRVDEYAAALDTAGPGLAMARDLVREGAAVASADFYRFYDEAAILEPSLRDTYADALAAPDPGLVARLRALHELPEGSLGRAYVDFYDRNGLRLPGDDLASPAVFVAHDMCHVIGGYEPTAQGEIALGGMELAVSDTPEHWMGFLGNLSVHEAAIVSNESITGKTGTLGRPGVAEYVAHGMWRGAQCTGDFTTADHLAMAHLPLDEVRDRFGVPPLEES